MRAEVLMEAATISGVRLVSMATLCVEHKAHLHLTVEPSSSVLGVISYPHPSGGGVQRMFVTDVEPCSCRGKSVEVEIPQLVAQAMELYEVMPK